MNIGTFYKALSYACLYKSEAGNVSEILNMDITVSLVREQKPVILLEQLAENMRLSKSRWHLSDQRPVIPHTDSCNRGA